MDRLEWIKYSMRQKLHYKLKWTLENFTELIPNNNGEYNGEFVSIKQGKVLVKYNEEFVELVDQKIGNPVFDLFEKIRVTKEEVPNLEEDKITTTIAKVIFNDILLVRGMKNHIPFIKGKLDLKKDILNKIPAIVAHKEKNFTANDLIDLSDGISALTNYGDYFVSSGEMDRLLPPDGLNKIRDKVWNKYETKYGKEWVKNKRYTNEYEKEMLNELKDKLKDDPAFGVLLRGKIINVCLKKLFISAGSEQGFNNDDIQPYVKRGLFEGVINLSEDETVSLYNSMILASVSRGMETQFGGVIAKFILRALSNVIVEVKKDCGTSQCLEILVEKDNAQAWDGFTMVAKSGNKYELTIDELNKMIGKKIKIRHFSQCLLPLNICGVCAGRLLRNSPNKIALAVTDISTALLIGSLKSLHGKDQKNVDIDLNECII